jgi:IS30 family transposase
MSYKHLNSEERDRIAIYRNRGWSLREIAKKLKRHPSTLSRELKRNHSRTGYYPHKAHEKARMRKKQLHKRKRLKTYALRLEVEKLLMQGWSPEIIAGRLRKENGGKTLISHEAIYQWIYAEAPYLIGYLAQARIKRRSRKWKRSKKARIPNRISIEERPKEANERKEIGQAI